MKGQVWYVIPGSVTRPQTRKSKRAGQRTGLWSELLYSLNLKSTGKGEKRRDSERAREKEILVA